MKSIISRIDQAERKASGKSFKRYSGIYCRNQRNSGRYSKQPPKGAKFARIAESVSSGERLCGLYA